MIRQMLVVALVVSLAVWALPGTPARAQTIQVVVDGNLVQFDQPPASIGGRILVPLRGVFERLGATVQWNPATSTATAVRGTTQVQLTIGSRQAFVNGRVVALDVPALIVGGRTLVPLRFVSEAMGASVDWDNNTRTAYIISGQAQPVPPQPGPPAPPQPTPPPPQSTPPPQPAPLPPVAVVEGTVLRVDTQASPQRILVDRDARIYTFAVSPDTAIIQVDVATGRETTITLDQIRTGYFVRVTGDTTGRAILIRVSIREVAGRIDAVTGRQIALAGGQTFTFADDLRIVIDGREGGREQLRPGMEVTLRLHPQTGQVLDVSARAAAQPIQPPGPGPAVRITSFVHDAQRPLHAGDSLTVTLQGAPSGTATFDISSVATGLPMREVQPGVYQGTYVIRAGDNVTSGAIFGRLRVSGQDAPLVQAGTSVTIDTLPPAIVQRVPEAGATVQNLRPNILITFNDRGGSGINPAATRLVVNGQDVTAAATIGDTAVAYSPPTPLTDRITVRLILADRAGNVTDDQFEFRIAIVQTSLIRSVTVNPTRPLRAGDVLTVTMTGEAGAQAAFRIEGIGDWIPMADVQNQPGTYLGSYTVRPGDTAQNARILVRMTRGPVTNQAAASTRLTLVPTDVVPAPVISSPTPGSRVRAPIVIRGRAAPGHQVVVRLDYSAKVVVFDLRGTLGQVTTTADASGNWSVTFNQDAPVADADITINATAIDPLSRPSQPAVVTVKQG